MNTSVFNLKLLSKSKIDPVLELRKPYSNVSVKIWRLQLHKGLGLDRAFRYG